MRTKILMVLALVISISVTAQTKKWTLQECVNHAIENNISIKRGQNSLLILDEDNKAAKGAFLPSVIGSVSQGLSLGNVELFPGSFTNRESNTTSVSVGVSQSIFNGFRNKNLHKQSLLNLERGNLELERIKDDISLNVVNSYLNVLFNKENLARAQKQYDFTTKQLNQVKELVEAGVQPKANINDVEATLSNDMQKITIAENNLDLARLSLSQLLQVPYTGFDVEIIDVNLPTEALLYDDVTPILDYAYKNRNEIKIAEKNIENAELSTEISKSGFMPTVSGSYGFGTNVFFSNLSSNTSFFNQLNDNKGHNFSIRASIPIFSRFQNKTAVAKSKLLEETSKFDLEQSKLNLESNIQTAFTQAKAAYRTYEAAKTSLEAQQLSFNNSEERYNIGSMNSFDLEQGRIRLINAEASLINAKYDFVFKTKVLDFYLGKPIGNVK
ncbi:MAG: transporter [Lutibacter sp.]|nr:MAG: transporter [Lutibacter sp.]